MIKKGKNPKHLDTRKIAVIILQFEQCGFTVICPNVPDWMANSVDPDQTAPSDAVWSRSALFAQTLTVWKLRISTVRVLSDLWYHWMARQAHLKIY